MRLNQLAKLDFQYASSQIRTVMFVYANFVFPKGRDQRTDEALAHRFVENYKQWDYGNSVESGLKRLESPMHNTILNSGIILQTTDDLLFDLYRTARKLSGFIRKKCRNFFHLAFTKNTEVRLLISRA